MPIGIGIHDLNYANLNTLAYVLSMNHEYILLRNKIFELWVSQKKLNFFLREHQRLIV